MKKYNVIFKGAIPKALQICNMDGVIKEIILFGRCEFCTIDDAEYSAYRQTKDGIERFRLILFHDHGERDYLTRINETENEDLEFARI